MKMSFEDLDDMITTKELELYLKFGYAKTLEFIKYSGIPYKKVGNAYRVRKQDLEMFLSDNQTIIPLS